MFGHRFFHPSALTLPAVPTRKREEPFINDARGVGLMRDVEATSPWLKQAANDGLDGSHIKPVEHSDRHTPYVGSRCFLIFNPLSANLRSKESTPRALAVRSANYPASMIPKEKKREKSANILPAGVFADATVDATGTVTEVRPVGLGDQRLDDAVISAVKHWQFAPARHEGAPVAASCRVPVLFRWPDFFNLKDLTKPPRAIQQAKPIYPISERAGGFNGEVKVRFVVTSRGDVADAVVHQSNNPNFNEPALAAVRAWKFEPGSVDGRPVNAYMEVPMVFELDGVSSSDRYSISKAKSSKLPAGLQNDFPPKVKNVALGVYPFERLLADQHATVTVGFAVRPDGKVQFIEQKGRELSDFDRAARAMVEEFEFVPASKDGKPNWGMLKTEVKFESGSDQVPVSASAHRILRELKKKEPHFAQANQVDQKLEPISRGPPIFPSEAHMDQGEGRALIEFFIDEEGQAQLPRIVSSTSPSFGYAAAQAVARWRFKPMTRAGKPVVVRLQVPMIFSNPAAKSVTQAKQENKGS